jgi:hypothetical protein
MLAKMDNQVDLDRKDHPDPPEIPAVTDHEVNQARQLSALHLLPAIPDPQDPMDHPAPLVNQAPKATMAIQVLQVPKVHPAQLAVPAKMVIPVIKVHPDPMAPKANRVSARNTALWTAVSSSKMAQDAKKPTFNFLSFLQSRRTNGYGERLRLFAINPTIHLLFTFLYFKHNMDKFRKVPHSFFFA